MWNSTLSIFSSSVNFLFIYFFVFHRRKKKKLRNFLLRSFSIKVAIFPSNKYVKYFIIFILLFSQPLLYLHPKTLLLLLDLSFIPLSISSIQDVDGIVEIAGRELAQHLNQTTQINILSHRSIAPYKKSDTISFQLFDDISVVNSPESKKVVS